MKLPWGRIVLALLLLAAVFAAATFLAPEIDASGAREPLKRALRETTGRHVELGEVRYQVFPFVGVMATDLVIPDDPEFGLEPIAYVAELQAGLHWPSLLSGRLRIGSVRLVEPSINLARRDTAGWNVTRLLQTVIGRAGGRPAPRMEIRGGRMNFRDGTLKSVFFLNEVDLDLDPPSGSNSNLEWSYEASPARTDRSESGFGRFKGRGAWRPASGADGHLEIDLELERSLASEVLTLVTGRDLGLQGRLSTRAQLDGPINNVKISGTLRVENPGQQSFFGFRGEAWTLPYQGRLDLLHQEFRVATVPPGEGERLPLTLEASCRGLLSQPRWAGSFGFDGLPAPVLIDLAQRFGVRAPAGLVVQGNVHGSIEYTQDQLTRGRVALRDASVALADAGPLTFTEAMVVIAGSEITLEPAAMSTPANDLVELSGRWELDNETAEFKLGTKGLPLPALRSALDNLPNVPRIPALEPCSQGEVRGELRFERRSPDPEAEASWFGDLELERAVCSIAGAPELQVERAAVAIRGSQWSVRKAHGRLGASPFAAELDCSPTARRPFRVALALPRLDGAALDTLFQPALRRPLSFLERTFRSRVRVPAWLAERHIEGTLRVGELEVGGIDASNLVARFYWDGVKIEFPDLAASAAGGSFSGRGFIVLGGVSVNSRILGRADGIRSGGGVFDADLDASWQGFGPSLYDNLLAQANVTARTFEVAEQPLRMVQACLDFDGRRGRDRLRISCLEALSQGEHLDGTASHIDSKWTLDFAGPRRQFRLLGTFSPMEWSLEPRGR